MQDTGSPAPLLVSNYSFLVGRGAGIVGVMKNFSTPTDRLPPP